MDPEKVAELLGQLTGHQLPQASISAMERGFDGDRRRRFDAHELYLLARVFDVPIVYFFTPPPQASTAGRLLADTGQPVWDLYAALLGRYAQLQVLDERLGLVDSAGGNAPSGRWPPSSAPPPAPTAGPRTTGDGATIASTSWPASGATSSSRRPACWPTSCATCGPCDRRHSSPSSPAPEAARTPAMSPGRARRGA
jgi:hypothetical protein